MRAERERARLQSTQRGAQLEHRYAAERELARAALVGADDGWVRSADLDEVVRLTAVTAAWVELEPAEFGPCMEQLREQVERTRDDADLVLGAAAGPAGVVDADASRRRREAETADQRGAAVVSAGIGADAAADVAAAAEVESAAVGGDTSRPAYDTPARRAELYQRAVAAGADEEVAAGRVLSATAQTAPVGEAIGKASSSAAPGGAAGASAEHARATEQRRGHGVQR
ncbi:hypothetical protein [Nocardioides aurantiacus]|uniref:hypothetical protein n=1 Tax=Nocardioides aurantiacus TaxID=86796 RepID=UPI000F477FBB|nr:hypothetical protein [Nocardioides aurantiacus]